LRARVALLTAEEQNDADDKNHREGDAPVTINLRTMGRKKIDSVFDLDGELILLQCFAGKITGHENLWLE
jgi:hypothetical protein